MWRIIRESNYIVVVEKDTYNKAIKTFISQIKKDSVRRDNYLLENPEGEKVKIFDEDYGLL